MAHNQPIAIPPLTSAETWRRPCRKGCDLRSLAGPEEEDAEVNGFIGREQDAAFRDVLKVTVFPEVMGLWPKETGLKTPDGLPSHFRIAQKNRKL